MREIKFRAWHKRERKWCEPTHIGINGYRAVMSIYTGSTWFTEGHYPDDFELVQFTGLLDHHDKEIYEGDIIEYIDNTSRGLVKKIVTITDIRHLPDFSCSKWEGIIGNIYENPELVREE